MKKLITLALICILGLAGCSKVDEEKWDMIPMVMVDGTLYLDTGHNNTEIRKCGTPDGEITSTVDGTEKPAKDNQSNFGSGYGYQYGATEGTIEIYMDNAWRIFATEEVRQQIQFPEKENEEDKVEFGDDDAVDMSAVNLTTDVSSSNLTMRTLKALVERYGEDLTWSSFDTYSSKSIGSGLYILRYPINDDYSLWIGGTCPDEAPWYIRLVSEQDTDNYIDVRTESIDDFINNP